MNSVKGELGAFALAGESMLEQEEVRGECSNNIEVALLAIVSAAIRGVQSLPRA